MSTVSTLTATGVATGKHAILYGITVSTVVPTPPPTGDLIIDIRDSAAADGTGDLIARMVLGGVQPPTSQMNSITFDGVRCANGIAVNITNSAPDAHDDIVVSIEYE
jgi:hypothetical protein